MDLSLIICTRNRAAALGRCLDAVRGLGSAGGCEVVLVDNGSSDATREVIEAWAKDAPLPVRYVHEPVPGLGNARNAGLDEAKGAIIAFTDDDCYVAPDFLAEVRRAFEDPSLGFVSGRILLHDPTDFPATINESTVPVDFAAGRYLPPGSIRGANLAFRRAALDQVGGFDPLFGSGALFPAEDIDTAGRCSLAGWAGRYEPRIVVSHHHGRKAEHARDLYKAYDYGRGAYLAKLMIAERRPGAALRGLVGLPRRIRSRPSTLWWELSGALRYARERLARGRRT